MTKAKQESDSESGRESESTEREKDGYLAFNQLGHWTLTEGRNNFYCKGKFNMLCVFVVAIVEKIPVYRWVLMGLGDDVMNHDLSNVNTWLTANKLTLNSSKTEFMLIGSRQRLGTYDTSPKLIIGGDIINQVSSVKSLGVHIDENLSWNMHIEKIAKKIASGIGAIKRCRPFINRTTLESVFNALVQPYFNYCSEVWGHCNKSLSNRLQKLQNRAARILTFSSYDTSADPIFEQLNWKRLDTQRQIQVATMVYKSIHGLAPDYLGSLFTKYDPPYNLRNSENKLAVPLPRTNFLKNSFSYNGAVIWNSLSPELRQAKSLQSFRNGCRDFFA